MHLIYSLLRDTAVQETNFVVGHNFRCLTAHFRGSKLRVLAPEPSFYIFGLRPELEIVIFWGPFHVWLMNFCCLRSPTTTCFFTPLLGLFLHDSLGLLVFIFVACHKLQSVFFWGPLQLCWRALFSLRSPTITCPFISLLGQFWGEIWISFPPHFSPSFPPSCVYITDPPAVF